MKLSIDSLKKFYLQNRFIKLPTKDVKPNWDASEMEIVIKVAEIFITNPESIFGKERKLHIVQARHLCSYILHRELKISVTRVSDFMGKNHSTITFSCNDAIPKLINRNTAFVTKKEIDYDYFKNIKSKEPIVNENPHKKKK